jgi:hypothetical protein
LFSTSDATYVFRYDGSDWVEEAELLVSGGEKIFRRTVAISGDVAIVGVPKSEYVDVFRYQNGDWIEDATLTAPMPPRSIYFGDAISISGDTILIGGFITDSSYVYRYDGSNWVEEATLTPAGLPATDSVGGSVSISGNTAVVGVWSTCNSLCNTDSAYLFRRDGSQWAEVAKLESSDIEFLDVFGWAVSVSGDTVMVGAYGDDDNGPTSGSVYVFDVSEPPANSVPVLGVAGTVLLSGLVGLLAVGCRA